MTKASVITEGTLDELYGSKWFYTYEVAKETNQTIDIVYRDLEQLTSKKVLKQAMQIRCSNCGKILSDRYENIGKIPSLINCECGYTIKNPFRSTVVSYKIKKV